MTWEISWIIAKKDMKQFVRKRTVLYAVVVLPLIMSVLFPTIIGYTIHKSGGTIRASELSTLLGAFSWWYVVIPTIIPTPIASYSIIGEKVEKSLEPLLAAPVTDSEVFLGKSIAAFIPAIAATYVGASIFMILMDTLTYGTLKYYYFPNSSLEVVLLILAPLAIVFSIQTNVIASSKVNDVRTASQLGGLMFFPFIGVYLASEIGVLILNTTNLLYIGAIIAVADIVLFRISTATFRREEILTKWR
jgi:ABC-2 type transport system permease protein